MELTHSSEIHAARQRVFDYLNDPEKIKQWARGMEDRIDLTPDSKGVGARFKQRIREGGRLNEYDGEILAYDPPAHLRVRLARGSVIMTIDYRLTELSPTLTRLDQSFGLESASPVMRWIGRLFAPFTRSLVRKQLDAFKRAVAGG
jgi:uncharacterized protein YndB with AHSA1/START domain